MWLQTEYHAHIQVIVRLKDHWEYGVLRVYHHNFAFHVHKLLLIQFSYLMLKVLIVDLSPVCVIIQSKYK